MIYMVKTDGLLQLGRDFVCTDKNKDEKIYGSVMNVCIDDLLDAIEYAGDVEYLKKMFPDCSDIADALKKYGFETFIKKMHGGPEIGSEWIDCDGDKCVVLARYDDVCVCSYENWLFDIIPDDCLEKPTGRRFPEVAKMMDKIKEDIGY